MTDSDALCSLAVIKGDQKWGVVLYTRLERRSAEQRWAHTISAATPISQVQAFSRSKLAMSCKTPNSAENLFLSM